MILFRAGMVLAAGLGLAACQTDTPVLEAPPSPTLARAEPEAVRLTPDRLIGLNDIDIKGYFGQPSLKRKEAGAEFWQYADAACVMDLYFYEDKGSKQVSYVTLRDPVSGRVGGGACQDKLGKVGRH